MNFLVIFKLKKPYLLIKLLFDLVFSFTLIILGSPLFLLIALLIKISSKGPILYRHKRIGKNNKYFYCIKFRTMYQNSDKLLKNLLDNNENLKDEFKKNQKIKNDPRIIPIGQFLRKTSLDELPQFINVIKMEMSVVGPRPIVDQEVIKYGSSISKVLSIKPGITGLWQVSGRNNLSYKKRVFLDNAYIDNINFFSDLKILFKTIWVLLFPLDRGAY